MTTRFSTLTTNPQEHPPLHIRHNHNIHWNHTPHVPQIPTTNLSAKEIHDPHSYILPPMYPSALPEQQVESTLSHHTLKTHTTKTIMYFLTRDGIDGQIVSLGEV